MNFLDLTSPYHWHLLNTDSPPNQLQMNMFMTRASKSYLLGARAGATDRGPFNRATWFSCSSLHESFMQSCLSRACRRADVLTEPLGTSITSKATITHSIFSQPNESNGQDRRQQGIKIICWQAQHIEPISSAWHTIIRLNAPSSSKHLTLMDGDFHKWL